MTIFAKSKLWSAVSEHCCCLFLQLFSFQILGGCCDSEKSVMLQKILVVGMPQKYAEIHRKLPQGLRRWQSLPPPRSDSRDGRPIVSFSPPRNKWRRENAQVRGDPQFRPTRGFRSPQLQMGPARVHYVIYGVVHKEVLPRKNIKCEVMNDFGNITIKFQI